MSALVVGLGTDTRGDDAAGLLAAAALGGHVPEDVEVLAWRASPLDLLALPGWRDAHPVVILDAIATGGPPGRVVRIEVAAGTAPPAAAVSGTHTLGLAATLALADALGHLPRRLVLFGIEGQAYERGDAPSAACLAGVDEAVAAVAAELRGVARVPAG